jgi:nitrilase
MSGDVYPTIKVAAVQAAPVFLDRDATVEKACRLVAQAGEEGAKIIVFPETFIPGYPHWYSFYIALSPEVRSFNVELFKNSVEVPGPATQRLGEAARQAGAYVVMGINEKPAKSYGTLYNSMIFFGPSGEMIGKRRKLIPTITERLVHANGDGSGLNVFETPYGGLSGLMCGENTNNLAKFTLLAQGEVIHAAMWPAFALDTEKYQKDWIDIRIRDQAFCGKVWVISSSGVISEEMKDALKLDRSARARFNGDGGHSSIISPKGQFVAGPMEQGEGILYADINLQEVVEGRIFQDITGHYNRFDIFRLTIDKNEYPPISMLNEGRSTNEPSDPLPPPESP